MKKIAELVAVIALACGVDCLGDLLDGNLSVLVDRQFDDAHTTTKQSIGRIQYGPVFDCVDDEMLTGRKAPLER